MKKHLRLFLFNATALWLVTYFLKGVTYSGGWLTIAWASLALTFVNLVIKPLIKLLLLPINLLTLGAFRWLINVAILYLVTILIPQFKIQAFLFSGLNYQGFIIPSCHLAKFSVYVVASLLISLITTFLLWLARK